jgi:hypothetical protein
MNAFLRSLLAAVQGLGRRCPRPPQDRNVRLHVETMEERLVPSVSALRAPEPQAAATSGPGVASPERCHCVHGYKWRPRPLAFDLGGVSTQQAEHTLSVQAFHLAVGGTEGAQVLTSADGHLVIRPTEGPLPTEL